MKFNFFLEKKQLLFTYFSPSLLAVFSPSVEEPATDEDDDPKIESLISLGKKNKLPTAAVTNPFLAPA